MFPGKLPIHLNGETRHPAALVTCSLRGRALCAGLCSPRCRRRGRRQRHRRRPALPPAVSAAAGSREAMQGSEGRAGTGGAASHGGSRARWGTLSIPARVPGAAGAAVLGKRPAASGGQGRRCRSLGGAVEALSAPKRCRASLPGRFSPSPPRSGRQRCCPPRVACPRWAWANTCPDKQTSCPAGAAVTEGPRRVMHGRCAAAR